MVAISREWLRLKKYAVLINAALINVVLISLIVLFHSLYTFMNELPLAHARWKSLLSMEVVASDG